MPEAASGLSALLASLVPLVPFFLLASLRVGAMLASLPAPLGTSSPAQVRVGLALAITLAVGIPMAETAPRLPLDVVILGVAALGEVLVGAVIGLTVRVTLAAADVAGNIAGLTMGQGFAQTVDPTLGEQTVPLGRILAAVAVLLFFVLQGPHVLIASLAHTLRVAPVGRAFGAVVHAGLLDIGRDLLAQGLRIASPVVGTMFLVQLGMGLVARSAPRVQIFVLTFAVTNAVGALVLLSAAPSVVAALADAVGDLPQLLRRALAGT
ncbi:MAG: flagellar biosynthetic protein FliR [Sandaracinaceae bacterium]